MKKSKRRVALGGAVASAVMALFLLMPGMAAAEQDPEALTRLRRVRADIDRERDMAAAGVREADDLVAEISRLDDQLLASERKLGGLREQGARLEKDYSEALGRLRDIDDRHREAGQVLTRRMSKVYRRGRLGSQRALAETASSSEPLRMARYLAAIWLADKEATEGYESAREEQRLAVEEIERKRAASAASKMALKDETVRHGEGRRHKEQLLARVRAAVGEHEVTLKRLAADEDTLKRLTGARGGAAPVAAVRSVLARLFAGEPEGAFSGRRGSLEAPVAGTLAARYGEKLDGDTGTGLKGLRVRGRAEASVSAVADGEVVFAGPFPGLGNMVIVNHGERYHSVYARLGKITRDVGHRVAGGESIGRLGRADTTLHFELRAEGRPLDPSQWLSKGYAAFTR